MKPLMLCTALILLAASAHAGPILITEVVTDPQGDHSENSGGNGVAYDAVPGNGTISSVDEYVELYNAGGTVFDLRDYVLRFWDTTPSEYFFRDTPGGVLRFSGLSSVDAFMPGDFVLLGNPPGALNNSLRVDLETVHGMLFDSVRIPDGNATGASDEAVARAWTGFEFKSRFVRAPISPLGFGEPVPEPPLVVLAALLSLLPAWRRRPRRPAPGCGRTRLRRLPPAAGRCPARATGRACRALLHAHGGSG